jgi:hypothetical protein
MLMKNEDVVHINGRPFSQDTGLPIDKPLKKPQTVAKSMATGAKNIHSGIQRSQTLVRRAAKRPDQLKSPVAKSMDISRSARISRFAPNPIIKNAVSRVNRNVEEIQKQKLHPLMNKVNKSLEISRVQPAKTLQQTKEEEINKTVSKTTTRHKTHKTRKKFSDLKHKKLILITSIIFAILTLGYLSYQFVPAISIRIAASQAKISATYPTYTPDGYRMSGPIIFDDSNVVIKYKQNAGDKTYTIYQSNSTWDSSAVQLNIADKWASKNLLRSGGITIFTTPGYDKAAWVNHGILYTITSDANLDSDKITRIVSSM